MSTLLSTAEGEAGGHRAMLGSNALVNILKPVNIVSRGKVYRRSYRLLEVVYSHLKDLLVGFSKIAERPTFS